MSKKLLTKEEVLKLVRTARGEFVKLLAQTAYDALVRVEEMQERQVLFADAVKDQVKIDALQDEIMRLREQVEGRAPLLTVFIHRDGKVLVCGEHGKQDLCLVHVPELPDTLVDERQDVVIKQLKFQHREAFINEQLKVIGRGHTRNAMTLSQYQNIKAHRLIHQLATENEALKFMLQDEGTPCET